jgi:hypothetical protein
MHAFLGAVMGYYVGRSRFERSRRYRLIGFAYASAVVLHGGYDFPLLTLDASGDHSLAGLLIPLSLVALTTAGIWALRVTRRTRHLQVLRGAQAHLVGPHSSEPSVSPRWVHILQTVVGGVAASVGGVLTFGIALAFLLQVVLPEERLLVLWGGFMVGVAPLAIGGLLFFLGVRGLNRVSAQASLSPKPASDHT